MQTPESPIVWLRRGIYHLAAINKSGAEKERNAQNAICCNRRCWFRREAKEAQLSLSFANNAIQCLLKGRSFVGSPLCMHKERQHVQYEWIKVVSLLLFSKQCARIYSSWIYILRRPLLLRESDAIFHRARERLSLRQRRRQPGLEWDFGRMGQTAPTRLARRLFRPGERTRESVGFMLCCACSQLCIRWMERARPPAFNWDK